MEKYFIDAMDLLSNFEFIDFEAGAGPNDTPETVCGMLCETCIISCATCKMCTQTLLDVF